MSRRRTNDTYTRFPASVETRKDDVDGFVDEQFEKTARRFPWKSLILILALMVGGIICLTLGIMISAGHFDSKYDDRAWPLLTLGIIMGLPGGYFGYILLCICLRRDGFNWDLIPTF